MQREDEGERSWEVFLRESFSLSTPQDVLFCLFDGGEESTHWLVEWAPLQLKEVCDSRRVCEITGDPVARFCGMHDDAARF